MGNNNSNQGNKTNVVHKCARANMDDRPKFLDDFYAIDQKNQVYKATNDVYQQANKMYNCIWDDTGSEAQLDVFSDPAKGINLPYYSNRNTISSDFRKDYLLSSENPQYIEFIYCQGPNLAEVSEKYRVNSFEPNHECKENCHCIRQFIEVTGNIQKVYNLNDDSGFSNMFSPVSPNRPGSTFSPTSSESVGMAGPMPKSKKGKYSGVYVDEKHVCPATMKGGLCPALVGGTCGAMHGGAYGDSETSPETTTDSDEEFDGIYSDTSEMSDTTTSPGGNVRNQSFRNNLPVKGQGNVRNQSFRNNLPVKGQGNVRNQNFRNNLPVKGQGNTRNNIKNRSNNDDKPDTDDLSETSDMSTNMKKRQAADSVTSEMENINDQDEVDDIDEDLEGLEDEDIMEDGFIFEQSDVTSSDLYRIQNRIFGSETDTEYEYTDSYDSYDSDDDNSTTDIVENAMYQLNLRKKILKSNPNDMRDSIFDSEDRDIMEMGVSSTEKYTKRAARRNNKYQ